MQVTITEVEETTSKHKYPILAKGDNGRVVLFDGLQSGTLLVEAPGVTPSISIIEHNVDWIPHTDPFWTIYPKGTKLEITL